MAWIISSELCYWTVLLIFIISSNLIIVMFILDILSNSGITTPDRCFNFTLVHSTRWKQKTCFIQIAHWNSYLLPTYRRYSKKYGCLRSATAMNSQRYVPLFIIWNMYRPQSQMQFRNCIKFCAQNADKIMSAKFSADAAPVSNIEYLMGDDGQLIAQTFRGYAES